MSAGVSERRSEKRRGRPRHPLLARFDGRASYLAPDVKTERGRANRAYAVDAMSIVDHADDPALAWIVDADATVVQRVDDLRARTGYPGTTAELLRQIVDSAYHRAELRGWDHTDERMRALRTALRTDRELRALERMADDAA